MPLQGVSASSSGTHTHIHWWEEQASSLALSGAPVCGMGRLPEGSRRDTGGVSVTDAPPPRYLRAATICTQCAEEISHHRSGVFVCPISPPGYLYMCYMIYQ